MPRIFGFHPDLSTGHAPTIKRGRGTVADTSDITGLAQRLRERLDGTGLNPFSAARRAGVGADYVRDILRGKVKNPSAARLSALAKVLETTVGYLLTGDRNPVEIVGGSGAGLRPAQPGPAATEPLSYRSQRPVMLPVRYELAAGSFREAHDVARNLGREPGFVPREYAGRKAWYEVLRDDHARALGPPGTLVLVVEAGEDERSLLQHGDFVVVQRRITNDNATVNVVERTLRRVNHRYPDLGLWFFDFCGLDEDDNGSDDIAREEMVERPLTEARIRKLKGDPPDFPEDEPSLFEEHRQEDKQVERAVEKLSNPEWVAETLQRYEQYRIRLVGRAVRVTTNLTRQLDLRLPEAQVWQEGDPEPDWLSSDDAMPSD